MSLDIRERTYLDSSKQLGSDLQALMYQKVHAKGKGKGEVMGQEGQRSGSRNKTSGRSRFGFL